MVTTWQAYLPLGTLLTLLVLILCAIIFVILNNPVDRVMI